MTLHAYDATFLRLLRSKSAMGDDILMERIACPNRSSMRNGTAVLATKSSPVLARQSACGPVNTCETTYSRLSTSERD